jgi:hypothetical protein
MDKNDEIMIEIAKNKSDEIMAKKELELAKQRFIEEIDNFWQYEFNNVQNKPIKKPKSVKFKEFWNKLKKVFGG